MCSGAVIPFLIVCWGSVYWFVTVCGGEGVTCFTALCCEELITCLLVCVMGHRL